MYNMSNLLTQILSHGMLMIILFFNFPEGSLPYIHDVEIACMMKYFLCIYIHILHFHQHNVAFPAVDMCERHYVQVGQMSAFFLHLWEIKATL